MSAIHLEPPADNDDDIELRRHDAITEDDDEGDDTSPTGEITTGIVPLPPAAHAAAAFVAGAANEILGTASVSVTALNVLCQTVGGAVLALAGAYQKMSFLPAVLFMSVSCYLSWFSVILIIKTCARTGLHSFQDLAVHASNNNWLFVRFFFAGLLIFPIGIIVAFMKVIGESMPAVMRYIFHPAVVSSTSSSSSPASADAISRQQQQPLYLSEGFWIVVATVILVPLCSFRHLSELVWVSVIGFATVLFTGLSIIYIFLRGTYTTHYDPERTPSPCVEFWLHNTTRGAVEGVNSDGRFHPGIKMWHLELENFFVAFPVMTMSLICQNNIPFYYSELRRRSEKRFMKVVYVCGGFTSIFYMAVGFAGYFVFGPTISLAHGNVLNCLSWNDDLVMMCRVLMSLHFLCVFPINCIAARKVLNKIIYPDVEEIVLSKVKLWLESLLLVGTTAVVAFEASGIEVVFAINGSLFGLLLTYALPAFCYIRLVNPCSIADFFAAKRAALETSSVGTESDQELGSEVDDECSSSSSGEDGPPPVVPEGRRRVDKKVVGQPKKTATSSQTKEGEDHKKDYYYYYGGSSHNNNGKKKQKIQQRASSSAAGAASSSGVSSPTVVLRNPNNRSTEDDDDGAGHVHEPGKRKLGGRGFADVYSDDDDDDDDGDDVPTPAAPRLSRWSPSFDKAVMEKKEAEDDGEDDDDDDGGEAPRRRSPTREREEEEEEAADTGDALRTLERITSSTAQQPTADHPHHHHRHHHREHHHVKMQPNNEGDDCIPDVANQPPPENVHRECSDGDGATANSRQNNTSEDVDVAVGEQQQQQQHHPSLPAHHPVDLADLTAPREVRQPSSLCWRVSVWFLVLWGVAGTLMSFIFSMHNVIVGKENEMSAE